MKKRILTMILLGLLMTGCSNKKTEVVRVPVVSEGTDKIPDENDIISKEQPIYDVLSKENVKLIGEPTEYSTISDEKIEFTVKDVKISKDFKASRPMGETEKGYLDTYEVKYDSKGTILNDFSYVWITLTIHPITADVEWNPLEFSLATIQNDNTLRQSMHSTFICIDEINVAENSEDDVLFKTYKKGEHTDLHLGFIIPDTELEHEVGYVISMDTVNVIDDNFTFIPLNTKNKR